MCKTTRAQVQGRTRRSRRRSTCCSSCTPTTSRTARTSAMRSVGSSQVDPYCAAAAGDRRPLRPAARRRQRGGAADARRRSGRRTRSPAFIEGREGAGERHAPDGLRPPRLQELRPARQDHQEDRPTRCSRSRAATRMLDIALELERIALEDEYFVKRKLYPNVDFYSGLIYQAMKLPARRCSRVLFAIARTAGLARAVAGDAPRQGAEDRPPAADLPRLGQARVRAPAPSRVAAMAGVFTAGAGSPASAVLLSAEAEGRTVLLEHEVYAVLASAGIDVPRHRLVADPAAIDASLCAALGSEEAVVKIASPDLLHKSDVGGVVLCRNEPAPLREASARVLAAARAASPQARLVWRPRRRARALPHRHGARGAGRLPPRPRVRSGRRPGGGRSRHRGAARGPPAREGSRDDGRPGPHRGPGGARAARDARARRAHGPAPHEPRRRTPGRSAGGAGREPRAAGGTVGRVPSAGRPRPRRARGEPDGGGGRRPPRRPRRPRAAAPPGGPAAGAPGRRAEAAARAEKRRRRRVLRPRA